MPTPIARRSAWLTALRSGTYKQGIEHLEQHNGSFCCLGVYCHVLGIARKEHTELDDDNQPIITVLYKVATKYSDWCDDMEPMELGGLSNTDISNLVSMNDTGSTFAEIADWIEQNTTEQNQENRE